MAKIKIEELFYGDKYGIMGEVVKQVFANLLQLFIRLES